MGIIQTVFFDVDNTVFDRERAQKETLRLIARKFPDLFTGIAETRIIAAFLESDQITMREYVIGLPPNEFRTRRSQVFLNLLGLSEQFSDEITAMYVDQYPTINAPVKGAREVIESLARRFRLGVISNGLPDVQYKKFDTLGIKLLLDCIVLSEELGVEKPNPEIFLHAVSLVGAAPGKSLYVGDSYEIDVVGAKKAGMQACWFNPTGANPSRTDIKPNFEIQALDEMLTFLNCP